MKMNNDIVARLRAWIPCYRADTDIAIDIAAAADEIELLCKERDEARREACGSDGGTIGEAMLDAEQRGWDCFKENNND